jgi:flagellar biosynthetic protein FlhB
MAASDKTEKATPKKRGEALGKGQGPHSIELNGAAILLASLLALSLTGPATWNRIGQLMISLLDLAASPQVVTRHGIPAIMADVAEQTGLALAPLLATCAVTGVLVTVLQTRGRIAREKLKPDPKRLNPLSGFKNLFGLNSVVETAKGLAKVGIIGAIVALALFPKLEEFGAIVGMPAAELLPAAAGDILQLAQRAALAYLLIGLADLLWQRHRFEKSIRMDKQEIKDEFKQSDLPAEVKSALRRKAIEAARRRMMDAVPTADVVVTNPTHYSVALRYDAEHLAPVVVAKGKDHVAFKIRELAREAGVAVIPDPPLARSLHATVEIGHMIPEELFEAVAQLLAYVYRVAGRRAARGRSPVASEARQEVAA